MALDVMNDSPEVFPVPGRGCRLSRRQVTLAAEENESVKKEALRLPLVPFRRGFEQIGNSGEQNLQIAMGLALKAEW